MTARTAERAKNAGVSSRLWTALSLVTALGLSGCAGVDSMLFGDDEAPQSTPAASAARGAPTEDTAGTPAQANYQPASSGIQAPVATITPISVEPGTDTGTSVSKTAAALRSKIVELENALGQNSQKLATLRSGGANTAIAYHESKARITTRLQLGTTRGNPELVSEWNRAQGSLDQLTANINALNALAKDAASDASSAHYALDQIAATLNVSGAVDEDHRQLRVLEDETNQTIVVIDRLLREVSDDVQRQTAYVANERANLTALAGAIKNGEFYGTDFGTQIISATGSRQIASAASGSPLVVIRFDRANKDYQDELYTALRQALQSHPTATFKVVAVTPTKGTVAAVQLAQTQTHRYAQSVLRSITDMGVPASRLSISSSTDPSVQVSEVQVYQR